MTSMHQQRQMVTIHRNLSQRAGDRHIDILLLPADAKGAIVRPLFERVALTITCGLKIVADRKRPPFCCFEHHRRAVHTPIQLHLHPDGSVWNVNVTLSGNFGTCTAFVCMTAAEVRVVSIAMSKTTRRIGVSCIVAVKGPSSKLCMNPGMCSAKHTTGFTSKRPGAQPLVVGGAVY